MKKQLESKQLTPDELVNKYLKQGSLDVNRQKLESLNEIRSSVIDQTIFRSRPKEIPIEQIPVEMQIAKDKSNIGIRGQSLEDEFNQKNNLYQSAQIEDEQARKEYAKKFIENARKNGYHITLSDDLQVTSVKPIRQPTNESDTESFEPQPSH